MAGLKLYRPNVGIVIFNKDKKVWIGKRSDINTTDSWQMPQGGIDKDEDPMQAAIREDYEETGIRSIKNIFVLNKWIKYDLPSEISKNKWNGKFKGQIQKWYLFYFYGTDTEINLNLSKKPEFLKWRWSDIEYIENNVTKFKKDSYKEVFQNFNKEIKNYY